jgi:hypothetical protein
MRPGVRLNFGTTPGTRNGVPSAVRVSTIISRAL